MDLSQLVGKYVDVSDEEGGGASGWCVKVDPPYAHSSEGYGQMLHFDYGMGIFVTKNHHAEEIEPPEGDPGMYIPDTPKPEFP